MTWAILIFLTLFFQEAVAASSSPGVAPGVAPGVVHVVDDDAHSLVEISVLLYGTPEEWDDLARVNRLKGSRSVALGQVLELHRAPTLSRSEGRQALLNYWRKKLSGEGVLPFEVPATPALSFSTPLGPQEIKNQAEKAQTPDEVALIEATQKLETNNVETALIQARTARKADPRFLPHWFIELRCLSLLKRNAELDALLKEFTREFPHLSDLPVIRGYLAKREDKQ